MLILAIESSCDETASAIIEDGRKVLSSVVASQIEEHKLYGGVVPEIASRRHSECISSVVEESLVKADLKLSDIDAIAVTYAPGLIGSLLVGVNFAKGLALASGKPLVPVHHLRGHIASNYLCYEDLKPPFLCMVVSGGHTHIIEVEDYTKLHIIGRTCDDAAGEAFDKAARSMGMPYPGGVMLDKIAETGDSTVFKFPRPSVDGRPYDFSFSGLKTSVINIIHNAKQKGEDINIPDLSASFRHAVVDCLVTRLSKVAKDKGYEKIVIAGGVCANSHLRRVLKSECEKNKWELYMPDISLCGDNAAMIGSQAYYEYLDGNIAKTDLNARAQRSVDLG